jgi:hypothetical protein
MKRWLAVLVLGLMLTVAHGLPAAAATTDDSGGGAGGGGCRGNIIQVLGFNAWDSCLSHAASGAPQLNGIADIWKIAIVVIDDFLKAGVYAATGFIIWGSVKYLKSQGDPGETTQARQIIHNALFGLVITLISVALVNFIASTFNA